MKFLARLFVLAASLAGLVVSEKYQYAPQQVPCPAKYIRGSAAGLHPGEIEWIQKMKDQRKSEWSRYIQNHNHIKLASVPPYGIAASGGGYRAMLNGAGALKGLDEGRMSGILRGATHLAGLSGGSWLVGTLATRKFPQITGDLWDLRYGMLSPFGNAFWKNWKFWAAIQQKVYNKFTSGNQVSMTDYWGLALSKQFNLFGMKWSDIEPHGPFPIAVAVGRKRGTVVIPENGTFEFSPVEVGSSEHNVFVETKYLGSVFDKCVSGYDNTGFVIGTSSNIFNFIMFDLFKKMGITNSFITKLVLGSRNDFDVANYPNSFRNFGNSALAKEDELDLVDGGEDGQNIPLVPLLQESRNLDAIIAIDSSNDINGYPNGASVTKTALFAATHNLKFADVPGSTDLFIEQGLNKRPVIFGCYASSAESGPIIIYIPNAEYNFMSGQSTTKFTYSNAERDGMIRNGAVTVTHGGNEDWDKCMACALSKRAMERNGADLSQCDSCFETYCWS
ncbi:Lysophospholipase 2 [Neolecta irregularis DAH-3]|uniref:Lysophospholipase n=1 Tax=Neolecta irregularis (strain DAH-3) TaxID=1198029 RepID=A0A1U7LL17_NEOID|nr:Lysophospholipase 2 [Neolecta irregularis DAH-3]|eukprot:OLL23350.1 Lysophospholipase 2 [Neolecta irregularis DAH-3]